MVDCFLVTVQAYSSPQVQSLGRIMLCYTNPTSLRTENSLLLLANLETAGLGVQVVVARKSSNQRIF
jgi:dethiobiotin synthetase